MNLNHSISPEELARLFAMRKDKNESHILWVGEKGDVHLDRLPAGMEEAEFEKCTPHMRVRFRTYRRGKGYVGKKAAADTDFIGRVHRSLTEQWCQARHDSGVRYLDRYC